MRALEAKLAACEERQRELQTTRLALEKEITVKKTSISIDRDRCLRLAKVANCQKGRSRYITVLAPQVPSVIAGCPLTLA